MTDLLCSWLNKDIKLHQEITKDTFEDEFSNGYLLGEILSKHGLQDDFSSFSKGKTSDSKLANFMKLEPTLRLLQVPFDTNTIHGIIVSKRGVAIKLLYQVYVALKKKKQNQLSGQAMEVMRPQARAKLEKIQTDFFQQRLKQQVPRQVDLTFKQLIEKFEEQRRKRQDILAKEEQLEEEEIMKKRRMVCQEALLKHRQTRTIQAEMRKKLKPLELSTLEQKASSRGSNREKETKIKKRVLEETMRDIAQFELNHNISSRPINPPETFTVSSRLDDKPTASSDYLADIKAKAAENAIARTNRDARRRKLLVDQMRQIQLKEDELREKTMDDRLMRQCLQEKRIATQLMQIRKEKDNIRNNRIERQKQYEDERNKMFQEALDKEALMAVREREEQKIMLEIQRENRKKIKQQKALENYEKHYSIAMGMIKEIVNLSTKIGEYRELTEGSIPNKLVRDWKYLFVKGKPLYEDGSLMGSCSSSQGSLDEMDSDDLLDNVDIKEYLNVTHEWAQLTADPIPDLVPDKTNPVLSHIVHRLIDIVTPPQALPSPPPFPQFYLKGAFLGVPYTGKTTALEKLTNNYDLELVVLCPCELVQKALDAYKNESAPTPREDSDGGEEGGEEGEREEVEGIKPSAVVEAELKITEEGGSGNVMEGEETVAPEKPTKQLSELATLGNRVFNDISNGDPVDDEVVVDIIIYEIRTLNEGCSWILDNFPTTLYQAQLLSMGLTGQGASALKEQSDSAKQRAQEFLLISKREVNEEELRSLGAACGLDIVIDFSATVDTVLARSTQYQKEMADPPDVQESLLSHDDNWSAVEKWFHRFRVLKTLDANIDLTEVSDQAENIVTEKASKLRQIEIMKKHGIKVIKLDASHLNGGVLSSRSVSKVGVKNKSSGKKDEGGARKSPSTPHLRKRRPSSAGNRPIWHIVSEEEPEKKRKKSAEETLFELLDPSIQPGTPKWQYYDEPVHPDLVHSLSQRWPLAEKVYSVTFRGVFRQLRSDRDEVCHYLSNRRVEFCKYLRRPDCKQEFVSQWQASYNEIESHLRREEIMKAELHHRVEDLMDKLWDICEVRKKETAKERKNILDNNWLLDKMGVVTNHYISLMNCELVKFQEAVLLLKDYYASMQRECPIGPLPSMQDRLPLIELPKAPKPGDPPSMSTSQQSLKNKESEDKLPEEEEISQQKSNKIPLMPRETPVVTDPSEEKTKRKSTQELIVAPREDISGLELDQQLIVHSYNTAIAGIFKLAVNERGIIEAASAEANQSITPVQQTEPKADKNSAKGKKGAKSPAPKKGAKSPAGKKGKSTPKVPEAPPADSPNKTPSVSPEVMAKKQQLESMRKEHMFALKHEESVAKARVQLIKRKALEFVEYIKHHSSSLYQRMDDWIGEFYKKEVGSVDQLGEVLRTAIEQEVKLKYELVLPGVDFEINQRVLMYPPTPPASPPPPREPTHPVQFTSLQLMSLYSHLKSVAPDGVIVLKKLIGFVHALANKSFGENVFPLMWTGLTKDTVTQICHSLYGKRAELVQWLRFFQFAAQPYPVPSCDELVDAFRKLSSLPDIEMDPNATREQLVWFNEDSKREQMIKQLLVDAHALLDESFDYSKVLFSLCTSSTIEEGIHKAFDLSARIVEQQNESDPLNISVATLHKVLSNGSHDNHFTLETTERLYETVQRSHHPPISVDILMQEESIIESLDTCVNYQLPDVTRFINIPCSTELSITPAND